MDDGEIIDLYVSRDEQAIEQTKLKYGSKCMQFALGILKNRQDAEEAVWDAYLALWNTDRSQLPQNLPAYLFRLVRNHALLKYNAATAKKRNSKSGVLSVSELEEVIPSDFDMENSLDAKRLTEIINSFLRTLSVSDRRVFICRYFADMKIGQIAKKYGMGQSGVKMSLYRSRKKLKEILVKENFINE